MKRKIFLANPRLWLAASILFFGTVIGFGFFGSADISTGTIANGVKSLFVPPKYPPLDKADYDLRLDKLAHLLPIDATNTLSIIPASSSTSTASTTRLWPVATAYPDDGAILPFKRVVAYYGNFRSKGMGVLGEYPTSTMIAMLESEVAKWNAADPETPVLPAIQEIAITAQGYPGPDKKYRARMPDSDIEEAIDLAKAVNGIVILDVQVGQSTLEDEVPTLAKWLALPQVHLAIDPEFAMQPGQIPGDQYVGSLDAKDINWTIDYLANIVKTNGLPPKILVIHRYREHMVTNSQDIETPPEVQVVMNMDGWGTPGGKKSIYYSYIYKQPVEFTGIKLFYKNDIANGSTMLATSDVMSLKPTPIYIQYQ
ncbi:MAG: hypothetical protein KGH93_02170 [Patescibacteria group bacterium]|nr:hypothetical protein [Patescibacteria group bacterium]MDE1945983.1 hypothetical protein [Patescibacteria group bacterium]